MSAFQDAMKDNFCWGCGADNPDGLQLKSHWDGDESVGPGCRRRSTPPAPGTSSTVG